MAAFDFPTSPTIGQVYQGYVWNGYAWTGHSSVEGRYVAKVGDTMTGFLTLSGAPTDPLHAATKAYVDSVASGTGYVAKAGDTMTGPLVLSGAPVDPLHAATKAYIDAASSGLGALISDRVAKAGDAMTGGLLIGGTGSPIVELEVRALGGDQDARIQVTSGAGGYVQLGRASNAGFLDNGSDPFYIYIESQPVFAFGANSFEVRKPGNGGVKLVSPAGVGVIEFYSAAGARVGTVGSSSSNRLLLVAEGGATGWTFSQRPRYSTFDIWDAESFPADFTTSPPATGNALVYNGTKWAPGAVSGGGGGGAATDITFTPGGNISAANVQLAIMELDSEKVAKAGDTMTGLLTLSGAPTVDLHAATKKYVDDKVAAGGGGGGAATSIADTAPASPVNGQLWWESDSGALHISYNDGNSSQWVQVNAAANNAIFEAPVDGKPYGRLNGAWTAVAPEALSNGTTYGRLNGAWTAVVPASGGAFTGAINVGGTLGTQSYVMIRAPSGADNADLFLADEAGAVKATLSWVRASGSVVLNTPGAPIEVRNNGGLCGGSGYITRAGQSGGYGSNMFNFLWAGSALKGYVDNVDLGDVSFTSDYRVKKNVTPLPSMWETVKNYRPISYTQADFGGLFKADDIERWGFLAHELQAATIPSAATGAKDADNVIQSPNPWTIIAALTKALQEAMARIEALEAR